MSNLISDRDALQFDSSVTKSFCFLITDYDFQVVRVEPTIVQYETSKVFINIYHGRQSFEIGVEIGLICRGYDSRFRLPVVLKGLLGKQTKHVQTFYQAHEKHVISHCVQKLALLVKEHCDPVLRGDQSAFNLVEKSSFQESNAITQKYSIEPIKYKADIAWKQKDYESVVSLYGSIKKHLNDIEKKRIDYARRQNKT